MTTSSDGQICYGIAFDEEYQFPWLCDKWDDNPEDWWFVSICKYKPPFKIYDKDGDYINGIRPSTNKINTYHNHYYRFKQENPMPVEIVRYCSHDFTMYIVAVIDTYTSVSSGYTTEIKTRDIIHKDTKIIVEFCEKYCRSEQDVFPEMKPCWLLSSMYG